VRFLAASLFLFILTAGSSTAAEDGVIGRKIGGDMAFDYSPVLRQARDNGLRWDMQRLETFLADPAEMFPGLWMSMRGIEDAADRRSLVRFLADPLSR
jgi:cytochrome c